MDEEKFCFNPRCENHKYELLGVSAQGSIVKRRLIGSRAEDTEVFRHACRTAREAKKVFFCDDCLPVVKIMFDEK